MCWYLAPGGKDPFEPVPLDQRHGYYDRPPHVGRRVSKCVGEPPGTVQHQKLKDLGLGKWRDDDQLWWTDAKPGDKLHLVVSR